MRASNWHNGQTVCLRARKHQHTARIADCLCTSTVKRRAKDWRKQNIVFLTILAQPSYQQRRIYTPTLRRIVLPLLIQNSRQILP